MEGGENENPPKNTAQPSIQQPRGWRDRWGGGGLHKGYTTNRSAD